MRFYKNPSKEDKEINEISISDFDKSPLHSLLLPSFNSLPDYKQQVSKRKSVTYKEVGEKSLTLEQIKVNIKSLYSIIRKDKDNAYNFKIDFDNSLSGYSKEELLMLLTQNLQVPKNVNFPEEIKEYAISKGLHQDNEYEVIEDGITHINMYSKGKTKLGRMLTNMSNIEFKVILNKKEVTFKSLEGYWYFLQIYFLTKKINYDFVDIDCFEAKIKGKEILANIDRGMTEETYERFKGYIIKGLQSKLKKNSEIYTLISENNLKFAHYYYYGNGEFTQTLPQYNWIVEAVEKISEEIKQEQKVLEKKKKKNFNKR